MGRRGLFVVDETISGEACVFKMEKDEMGPEGLSISVKTMWGEMSNLDKFRKKSCLYFLIWKTVCPVQRPSGGSEMGYVGASPIWHSSRSWWQVGPV